MTGASIPSAVAPRVADLLRRLGSDADAEALEAARDLRRILIGAGVSLDTLAGVIDPPEPIAWPAKTSRPRKGDPTSVRNRLAERLMRLVVNPRVDLTKWELDFVDSVVPGLRADLPLSDKQAANVERILKKPRRRLS